MASRLLDPSRRGFLALAVTAAGVPHALRFMRARAGGVSVAAAVSPGAVTYRCLHGTEATFIEAVVRTLCPADHLTPDGVECGVAAAFDGLLAETPARDRVRIVRDLRVAALAWRRGSGAVDSAWAHYTVSPLLMRACFVESVYDRYDNRVFWKMFGRAGEASV